MKKFQKLAKISLGKLKNSDKYQFIGQNKRKNSIKGSKSSDIASKCFKTGLM